MENDQTIEVFPTASRWARVAMWVAAVSMFGGMAFLMAVEIDKNKAKLRHAKLLVELEDDYEWNRYEEILEKLERTPDLVSAVPKVQRYKAISLIRTGKLQRAVKFLDELQKKHPKAFDLVILRAIALDKAGKYVEAIKAFPEEPKLVVRETDGLSPVSYILAAAFIAEEFRIHLRLKNPEHPLLESKGPKWLEWRFTPVNSIYASVLLLQFKQYEFAYWTLSHFVATRPESADGLNQLAWLLLTADTPKLRDPLRALELATKAAKLTRYKNAAILDTLAEACFQNGDIENAIKHERAAAAMYTQNREFYVRQLEKFNRAHREKKKRPRSRPAPDSKRNHLRQ